METRPHLTNAKALRTRLIVQRSRCFAAYLRASLLMLAVILNGVDLSTEHDGEKTNLVKLRPSLTAHLRPTGAKWKLVNTSVYEVSDVFDGVSLREARHMMGVKVTAADWALEHKLSATTTGGAHSESSKDLPTSYDVRDKWSMCSAISRVMTQGNCEPPAPRRAANGLGHTKQPRSLVRWFVLCLQCGRDAICSPVHSK